MNKHRIFSLILVCAMLLSGSALAASYDFDATVVCVNPAYITADIGGTVESVPVRAGQLVESGDILATLSTEKIYATADGTITGIFAEEGDSASAVTGRYGALMYIEPDSKFTIEASTSSSYNSSENKYVHVGEHVYLICYSDGDHTGEGFVSSVNGEDFTVEVTSGSFYMGETVSVCRDPEYKSKSRIGRGDATRIENIAVSAGEGADASIVKIHVSDGDSVKAGDLLAETLSGVYDGYYCTGNTLSSDGAGILASINATVGSPINKGDVLATLYPRENLQLKVDLNESNLGELAVGDEVQITFNWNEDADGASSYKGVVSDILYTAAESNAAGGENGESSESVSYAAYIDFDADESVRLGMTAIVYPTEEIEESESAIEAE